jgi:hypothetical protein
MANCTIADVAALVLTPGVRFSPSEHERVQAAIDATAQSVAEDADYATLMAARHDNAEAAAAKLIDPPNRKRKQRKNDRDTRHGVG